MHNYRVLTAVSALFFVGLGISAPLMSLFLEALGADYGQISIILTSYVAVLILSNFAWGRIADHLGRRKPLIIVGLFSLAVAYVWLSRSTTANIAWGIRILEGIGVAAYTTLSLAMMGDILQDGANRGRRMGIYRGLGSLAFSMGALMGGRIADHFGLATAFAVCAGLYFAAMLVTFLLQEVPAVKPATPAGATAVPPVRRKRELPALFLAGVVLWMAAHSASTSMWPNYMATFGYSKTTITSLWGLAAFIEMPAMYLSGALSDVFGRAALLASGGFAIALVQIGYMTVVTVLPALFVVQTVRGWGFGSYTANAMTFTAEQGDHQSRGGNSGLFQATGSVGQLVGIFIGGQLAKYMGFSALYTVCALLALGSGVCFLALRRQSARAVAAGSAAD